MALSSGFSYVRLYSIDEEVKIVKYIVQNNEFHRLKGDHLWKLMEQSGEFKPRTWQSLKQHFRKKIIHTITHPQFQLSREEIQRFSSVYSMPQKQFRKVKEERKSVQLPVGQVLDEIYVPRYQPGRNEMEIEPIESDKCDSPEADTDDQN